ncbi:hypothetical protein SJR96_05105 [Aeromonas caviae]|uniref:hypothetical protein n=1 Tax=Aeromonas caviae TaxID=648 RepID=UPI0029D8F2E1|nr:hypothetical protein [Aeromonas caviae]MDX7814401.1 hypothetical protein [Aeromonas caviae]
MAKINGFGWAVLGVIVVVGSAVAYLAMPAKQHVDISIQGVNDGVDRSEQVKANFTELAANCPAVLKAKSVVVMHEQGEALFWRNEKLGWQSDFYFQAVDRRGETHHFYLREDAPRELMVFAKQASLDWCGIDAKMKDYYLVTL